MLESTSSGPLEWSTYDSSSSRSPGPACRALGAQAWLMGAAAGRVKERKWGMWVSKEHQLLVQIATSILLLTSYVVVLWYGIDWLL